MLDADERRTLPPFAEMPEAMPPELLRHPERRPQWFARTRTLLTLDLLGEADARFTRTPVGVVGLQLGITWTREFFVRAPPPSPFGPDDDAQ